MAGGPGGPGRHPRAGGEVARARRQEQQPVELWSDGPVYTTTDTTT